MKKKALKKAVCELMRQVRQLTLRVDHITSDLDAAESELDSAENRLANLENERQSTLVQVQCEHACEFDTVDGSWPITMTRGDAERLGLKVLPTTGAKRIETPRENINE